MLRNLKNMPNNRGYIWKNTWLLGEKPAEPGRPTILHDRNRIEEHDEYETRIYEKRAAKQQPNRRRNNRYNKNNNRKRYEKSTY